MANPIDATTQAANGVINKTGSVLKGAWKYAVRPTILIGGGLALYGTLSTSGLAGLAPMVDKISLGGSQALADLTSGAQHVASWLSNAAPAVAAPAP